MKRSRSRSSKTNKSTRKAAKFNNEVDNDDLLFNARTSNYIVNNGGVVEEVPAQASSPLLPSSSSAGFNWKRSRRTAGINQAMDQYLEECLGHGGLQHEMFYPQDQWPKVEPSIDGLNERAAHILWESNRLDDEVKLGEKEEESNTWFVSKKQQADSHKVSESGRDPLEHGLVESTPTAYLPRLLRRYNIEQ